MWLFDRKPFPCHLRVCYDPHYARRNERCLRIVLGKVIEEAHEGVGSHVVPLGLFENMYYFLILYFVAGIAQDFLFTLSLRFVNTGKAFRASVCSFIETVVTLLVLYDILKRLDNEKSYAAIASYAFGIGVGTFFAMKFKIGINKK